MGTALTLGLVVRGPTDKQEAIPYLNPDQEPFLEYEVASAIASVGRGRKPAIGLLRTLPDAQLLARPWEDAAEELEDPAWHRRGTDDDNDDDDADYAAAAVDAAEL